MDEQIYPLEEKTEEGLPEKFSRKKTGGCFIRQSSDWI